MCEKKEKNSNLKQALIEYTQNQMSEYPENIPECDFSKRCKRRMNRFGREKVGMKKALHPEVDNVFERTRSKIVCWVNEKKSSQ